MKQFCTILLLMLMAAVSFSNLILVAEYYADTAAFAENCINKDKPYMHCNGKCQLKAKIAETDSNNEKQGDAKLLTPGFWVFAEPFVFEIKSPEIFLHKNLLPAKDDNSLSQQPRTHFHPPGIIT